MVPRNNFRVFCFVCLSGFLWVFLFLCFFFGFFSELKKFDLFREWGLDLSDLPSISSPFLDPRMTSVNVYPHMCPDAMHHEATGFLLAWSKSPFPNKRITVPCIRKKLNIHCPAVFILHVRCDRILIKCQTYLFLIPSIT